RRAQEDVQGSGRAHGRRARGGVLEVEVVCPDRCRQGGCQGAGGAARAVGEGHAGGGEGRGRGEGRGGVDAAGRDGAVGAVHRVLRAVGPVVEGHAGLVQAQGGADGEKGAAAGADTDGGGACEGVAGDGEQGGQTQQF